MGKKIFCFLNPLIIVLFLIVLKQLFPSKLTFITQVIILTIYIMGNNLLMGYMGYTSFGQPIYLNIGAYSIALYFTYFGGNILIAFLVMFVVSIIVSFIIGPIFLRLKGNYFTLINAAFCALGVFFFQRILLKYTRGEDGLWFRSSIKPMFFDIRYPENFFIFTLIVLLICYYFFTFVVDRSAFGTVLKASKNNPLKLKYLGYSVFKIRLLGYTISIIFSCLAGALYAMNLGFVNQSLGENSRAIEVLLATLIGGIGTIYGPFFGSLFFNGIKDILGQFFSQWEFFVGLFTLFALFKLKKGIWGYMEESFNNIHKKISNRFNKKKIT